jgi:hypothetical protein
MFQGFYETMIPPGPVITRGSPSEDHPPARASRYQVVNVRVYNEKNWRYHFRYRPTGPSPSHSTGRSK